MGPITIFDDCELSKFDIMTVCGVRPNKAYGGHITIYRKKVKLFCGNYEKPVPLSELYIHLHEEYIEAGKEISITSLIAFNKHIISLAKSYFNL